MAWQLAARGLLFAFGSVAKKSAGFMLRRPFTTAAGAAVADQAFNNGDIAKGVGKSALNKTTGIDLDNLSTEKLVGMSVAFLAVSLLGKSLIGNGLLGTIASVALGAFTALRFDDQIGDLSQRAAKAISGKSANSQNTLLPKP